MRNKRLLRAACRSAGPPAFSLKAAAFDFFPRHFARRSAFVPFLRTNLISTLLSNACATQINVSIVSMWCILVQTAVQWKP